MAISLDSTTQGEYLVGTTVAARSQAVVSAFTGTVTCKIYDGTATERAAATFDSPWASASGATVTIGEVGKLIVSSGGVPDADWYVEISNGTRWLRGTFGLAGSGKDFTWSAATFETGQEAELGTVTLTASVPDTTSAPANTALPVVNGTTQVGQTLSCSTGTWTGNPTPTYAYQWRRGLGDITGATSSTYTLTASEEGFSVSCRVTATNSAGSASATSASVGPVTAAVDPLTISATLPDPIQLYRGYTFDLSSYVSGGTPPYTYSYTGTLPSGVTLNASTGVFTVTSGATLGASSDIQFHVDDSVTLAELPTFGITSAVGGTSLPFASGHVFAEGDVPSGYYVNSDLLDWQCTPLTYWPDGSLRHAIIAGRADCTANVEKTITLSVSATDRSGTALTEANLSAALPTTTWSDGTNTISLNSLIGTIALHRTVCSGPVMSNWIYRRQVSGSNHLVIWFDVRLYIGGRTEVFVWAENAYLLVASPTSDTRTHTVSMGGTQRFSESVTLYHHTRIPLLNNSASTFKHWSYWSSDPQIEPVHDTDYMMATKMVPNYGWAPSETALASVSQTYSPNWIGNVPSAMGTSGFKPHIGVIPQWCAQFIASGADARAYRSVIANGYASGSWSMHYRDETTNEPFRYSDYPNMTLQPGSSPVVPVGSGGDNGSQDRAHQPSMSYVPWLITGRWFHLEGMLHWLNWSYLDTALTYREGADCLCFATATRARGWHLRTLAQALTTIPESHTCYASLKNQWEKNTAAYEGRYVTGTRDDGGWVNEIGWLGIYASGGTVAYYKDTHSGYWWDAGWMQMIIVMAFGHAWDLNPPQSAASKASHLVVRDFGYRSPVGFAGDGSSGNFNYRRFPCYATPIGYDNISYPLDYMYPNYGDILTVYEAYGNGGNAPFDALPAGTTIYDRGDPLVQNDWGKTSWVAMPYCALVMAAEHGATGATEALARITGSSSWSTAPAAFAADSVWAMTPR